MFSMKCKVSSACGARNVQAFLDECEIFRGVLPRASGQLSQALDCCGTILLTTQKQILEQIMKVGPFVL